jgi:hypothetical protein
MTDVPSTDDVRDIWVDYHLNPLPRAEGIALVPEYQQAFDAWLETIRAEVRADEQAKVYAFATRMVLRRGEYLREKVEALPGAHLSGDARGVVYRAAVLALLNGDSDDD